MFAIFKRKRSHKNVEKINQTELFISKWQEVKRSVKEYDKELFKDCVCEVYEGKHLTSEQQISARRSNSQNFETEIEIFENLKHPNLLICFGLVQITGSPLSYFIVEKSDLNLFELRKSMVPNVPNEKWIRDVLIRLMDAVSFLHSKNYIHRNICAENIGVFNHGSTVKLKNFKFAQAANRRHSAVLFNDIVQSPEYLSPESVCGLPYKGTLQDSWSVGIVLAYLIKGEYPQWELGADREIVDFLLFKADGCPYECVDSKALKDFMKMLLNVDCCKRSTVAGVVKNYIGSQNMKFVRNGNAVDAPL